MKIMICDVYVNHIIVDTKNIDYMVESCICPPNAPSSFIVCIKGKEFFLSKVEYGKLKKIFKFKLL